MKIRTCITTLMMSLLFVAGCSKSDVDTSPRLTKASLERRTRLIDNAMADRDMEGVLSHFASNVVINITFPDDPEMKAATLRTLLSKMKNVAYVGSSGMAGFAENNTIRTRTIHPGVYIVGDETSAAGPGQGLMAPRVGIAAHHQANQALRIILQEVAGRTK